MAIKSILGRTLRKGKGDDLRPKFDEKTIKVINYADIDGIEQKDVDTFVRLYEAITDSSLRQPIDIKLLCNEAVPLFKACVGEKDFDKIWRYFQRGYKENNQKRKNEIDKLLAKLITFENAQYYISGFTTCMKAAADLLCDEPEDMTTLEKAKFVWAYLVLFGDYHFFCEDFTGVTQSDNTIKRVVLADNVLRNNREFYGPERLFMLHDLKLCHIPAKSFSYTLMMAAIMDLGKDERKDFFKFAELAYEDGRISNINVSKRRTFAELRNLKMRISPIVGQYPAELLVNIQASDECIFVEMYNLYRILKNTEDWTTFPTVERDETYIEGSVIGTRKKKLYKVGETDLFASVDEMKRFVRYYDYFASHEFEMNAQFKNLSTSETEKEAINVGLFMAAQKYFQEIGYYDPSTINLVDEFFLANILFTELKGEKLDEKLREFASGKIDAETFRTEMGITSEFESEKFCLVIIEEPIDAFERFMKESGFELTEETRDNAVKALFEPFEGSFTLYGSEKIESDDLKKNICWDPEIIKEIMALPKDSDVSDIKRRMSEAIELEKNKDDTFEKFMESEGFQIDKTNRKRVYELIYEPNKKCFGKYEPEEISDDGKKKALIKAIKNETGYSHELASQIVDLDKVDAQELTQTLSDFKSKRFGSENDKVSEVRKLTILINFYDYLVSTSVKCGPDHKRVKPAKNFKLAPFKRLLAQNN